ncbi:hypothetical protein PMAYCL1PPCAC_18065, partial [Pristionchus mayeri]
DSLQLTACLPSSLQIPREEFITSFRYAMLPYRRASRLINFVIGVCLIFFIILFLQRPQLDEIDSRKLEKEEHFDFGRVVAQLKETDSIHEENEKKKEEVKQRGNKSVEKEVVPPGVPPETRDQQVYEANGMGGWENDLKTKTKLHVEEVIRGREVVDSVNYLNENFAVLNTDRFGPVENAKTVIVIQVHSRLEYLKYLVSTLSMTRGIEDALLVFSHDINIESIDNLVRNITFARVVQIFYPYNMQLFPHVFPGQHPRDCPEKITKDEAKAAGCQNWEHPDKYGNYRIAKFTQIKHHWWWKMNYVFDGIIDRYSLEDRWVLLLEEDHYMSPDALHVLNHIIERRNTLCSDCELISLGFYLKSFVSYGQNIDRLGFIRGSHLNTTWEWPCRRIRGLRSRTARSCSARGMTTIGIGLFCRYQ